MASQIPSSSSFRSTLTETLEDAVFGELMTKAVTLVPCGHTFNEDTVIRCIAANNLCPLDRQRIERHVPNYTVRHMAETNSQHPPEEPPTEAAQVYFQKGKDLSERGDNEEAIQVLLKALQLSPTYDKAQAYLDFCLQRTTKNPTPALQPPSTQPFQKETHIDFFLRLLENPAIQSTPPIMTLLENQVEELMQLKTQNLTPQQEETYAWAQKLLIDQKVSSFVAKKLVQMHAPASTQTTTTTTTPSSSKKAPPHVAPVAAVPATPTLPAIAFGAAEWKKYFGDVGAEPPLPSDIQAILSAPCPFVSGKKVQETHLLVLVPQTVNGQPLTMKSLGELVKKPLQGPATQYSYFQLGSYTDPAASKSHWALLTRDVVEGSRNKSYSAQQALIMPPYEVPTILDVTAAIFMEHVRTGTRLYSDSPWTYTRCQEKYDASYQLVVGGFSAAGVHVRNLYGGYGVGGLRKFC